MKTGWWVPPTVSAPRPARIATTRKISHSPDLFITKTLTLIFILILGPQDLWGQAEFFGYYESEADILQLSGSGYSFGYNKFRLDIEARPGDNVLIGANMNIQKYWGQTTWDLLDFLPDSTWRPVLQNEALPPQYWVYELPFSIPDTILLDNMYMRINYSILDLTLGRQQISPGVGYAWNPTDIFNTKTLLDPSYEQTGVSAIQADFTLAPRFTVNTILQPEDTWDNSTRQIGLKTGLGSFDLELTAAKYNWDLSVLGLTGLQKQTGKRTLIGGSFVGEIWDWGIWAEGAHNQISPGSDFNELVVGVDHTFDNSLYLLVEGLHNEFGAAQQSDLDLNAYLQSLNGEVHSLMQDYVFVYLMHQTFDYVSFSGIAFANLNDKSGTIGPRIDWNIFEDTNIFLQASYSWGEDDTEFGLQDWGLRLRLVSNF